MIDKQKCRTELYKPIMNIHIAAVCILPMRDVVYPILSQTIHTLIGKHLLEKFLYQSKNTFIKAVESRRHVSLSLILQTCLNYHQPFTVLTLNHSRDKKNNVWKQLTTSGTAISHPTLLLLLLSSSLLLFLLQLRLLPVQRRFTDNFKILFHMCMRSITIANHATRTSIALLSNWFWPS